MLPHKNLLTARQCPMVVLHDNLITQKNLKKEKIRNIGGLQRIYRLENGYGLQVIESTIAYPDICVWEIAVLKNIEKDGASYSFDITYNTSLTNDIETFYTEEEANAFIERAFDVLTAL